ncbi:MAG: MFS transporter [Desulfurococcales archaeon]|nr:MFS transporter [Desulfurococcales archaeon]
MTGKIGRAIALAGFPILVFASQVVWVSYSPVTTKVAADLGVSKDAVGLLVMLFPILYILMAYPAGRLLDTWFRGALITASILFIGTGIARIVAPENYLSILIGQILAAIAQPFVVNGITPYASAYFEEKRRPLAVSMGSAAMYAGMIVAMAIGAFVYSEWGVWGLSIYSAITVLVSGLWTLWMVLKANIIGNVEVEHLPTLESIRTIVKRREVWMFAGIIGIGLAILDILMTWIEPVLSPVGLEKIAGTATALMLVSGVIGASTLPSIAAKYNIRKTLIIIAAFTGVFAYGVLTAYISGILVYAMLALNGFMLMAGLPVIFEWVEKTTPFTQQGETIGVIMITGHIIAVIALAASTPLTGFYREFFGLLASLGVIATLLAIVLPSDKGLKRINANEKESLM